MQKRSALYECAKDSGKQSGNRPTGAHEVNPDLDIPKFWGNEMIQICWYSLNRRKCVHFPG